MWKLKRKRIILCFSDLFHASFIFAWKVISEDLQFSKPWKLKAKKKPNILVLWCLISRITHFLHIKTKYNYFITNIPYARHIKPYFWRPYLCFQEDFSENSVHMYFCSFVNPNWHGAGHFYPPCNFGIGFCQLNLYQKFPNFFGGEKFHQSC